MQWFLERISAKTLPICFGYRDKQGRPNDFAMLVKKGVLKRGANLETVPCDLCDENHDCQVRENDANLCYVCENGGGKKTLSNEDLTVYDYDNDAFLKLIADELDIKTNGPFSDEATYSENSFYRIGTWANKAVNAEVYYLRTDEIHEPSSHFDHLGNGTKMLITNAATPVMVWGKEGTSYCTLSDILASPKSKKIFDATKFEKCFDRVRRVRFDTKQAQLFLDGKLVYTAGLNSPEHHFLSCLWEQLEKQVPHADIYQFAKEALGRDVADPAQKFSNKMKSNIKQVYAGIDTIITVPTRGYYMMTDPS